MVNPKMVKVCLWFVGCSLVMLLGGPDTLATDVLSKASDGADKLHTMISGPIGKSVLTGGTLLGAWKAFHTGNILLVFVILGIGLGLGWHIESISDIFG